MKTHDLIIIGAGPAGLSAAVYAARYKLDAVVISKEAGGLAATAHKVCNFPSYKEISGAELMQKMLEQAESLGISVNYDNISKISKNKDIFEIEADSGEKYGAKMVIFAAGSEYRKLNIPGEKKFLGRGVSYCATCDAGFFKNKTVAVMGGGNAALTSALLLSEYCEKVYIIYRKGSFFRAEPAWVEAVEKNKKITLLFNEDVLEIIGDKSVNSLKLKSGKVLNADGLFVEIGSVPNTGILDALGIELEDGLIKVDKTQKTNISGLYAAGDITTGSNRFQQIITAASEGAVAVNAVFKELHSGSKENRTEDVESD